MAANQESIVDALESVGQIVGRGAAVVSCPPIPVGIPGITPTNVFTTLDAFGTIVSLRVPRAGIILSATYLDLDYEGLPVNLHIFNQNIVQIPSEDPWAPADADMLKYITTLAFLSPVGHTNSYTFRLSNIGEGYTAPAGWLWIQAQCVGAQAIAAGAMPRFQLQILSCDPDYKE